jgi:hypothetical protein
LATGILHDLNREQYWSSDLIIDFNGAAGMNGIFLASLGLGSRVVVVDHCPAAGEVAVKLGALVGVRCEYKNVTSFQTDAFIDPAIRSVFLLASHAQNVLYLDQGRDAALETQNQQTLQALATCFPNVETLSAISLEPARGARGLQNLLRPWQENFRMEKFCQIPVAKFGRGLRVGNKKYEAAILTKAMVQS